VRPAAHDLSLRLYPFPYRAAIAVLSHSQGLPPEGWAALRREFAEAGSGGLPLELGVTLDLSNRSMDAAGDRYLAAAAEAGAVEAIEGLPDDQASAVTAVAMLARHGLRPSILLPRDSMGADWRACSRGALGEALASIGVRFLGPAALLEKTKFGDHLDQRHRDRLRQGMLQHELVGRLETLGLAIPDDDEELMNLLSRLYNSTLTPATAPGSAPRLLFKRYSGPEFATSATFAEQVATGHLDALEEQGGAVVVQQHLGLRSLLGRSPERRAVRPAAPPWLDEHARVALAGIADRFRRGSLLATSAGRLLNLLWRHQALRFSTSRARERWTVTLERIDCPASGVRPVTTADLDGFALLVPADAPEVLVLGPDHTPLEVRREPDPAHEGLHAIHSGWASRTPAFA
jgi:hypothetical protein